MTARALLAPSLRDGNGDEAPSGTNGLNNSGSASPPIPRPDPACPRSSED